MLLTAQELLSDGGVPSRDTIREHISGNYCRCTGYQAIVDAIESVAQVARKGGDTMNEHTKPQSISQQADELEEEMMHELERVVTKSTLHYLADGEVKMERSADRLGEDPEARSS